MDEVEFDEFDDEHRAPHAAKITGPASRPSIPRGKRSPTSRLSPSARTSAPSKILGFSVGAGYSVTDSDVAVRNAD